MSKKVFGMGRYIRFKKIISDEKDLPQPSLNLKLEHSSDGINFTDYNDLIIQKDIIINVRDEIMKQIIGSFRMGKNVPCITPIIEHKHEMVIPTKFRVIKERKPKN